MGAKVVGRIGGGALSNSSEAKVHPTDWTGTLKPGFKEFLVVVPSLASALAIVYDIGYFSAVDVRYFSCFSLPEHLVFALQIIPLAFGGALVAVLFPTMQKFVLATSSGLNGTRISVSTLVLIATSYVLLCQGYFFDSAVGIFVGSTALFVTVLNIFFSFTELRVGSMPLSLIFVIFVSAFLLGVDTLHWYIDAPYISHIMKSESGEQEGKLIRSGEQGVLFYVLSSNEFAFVRWDKIESITTKRRPRQPWYRKVFAS